MLDYSKGTGENSVWVKHNLSPTQIRYLYNEVCRHPDTFCYYQTKVVSAPDREGLSDATSINIKRVPKTESGQLYRNPWFVEIKNGYGVEQPKKNGGKALEKGTFVCNSEVKMQLSDYTMFELLSKAVAFISAWETSVLPDLCKTADQMKKALQKKRDKLECTDSKAG